MAWSKATTQTILLFVTLVSFGFAALALFLIVNNLPKKEDNNQFWMSLLYLTATTFGTGLGCSWFRICQAKRTWAHGTIHIVCLACMLFAHREIFELLLDGEFVKCYNMYPISLLTISIYVMQFILTIHFILIRYGKTARQKSFNTSLHSFIGAITLFVCVTDGILICDKMSRDENLENESTLHLAAVCIFIYGIAVWFLILNPYFDWRRLYSMVQCHSSSSKVSFSNPERRYR